MSVKIRLARHGRKRRAFYHIIVADSRAPRDGKYIEKIGTYNPNTDPATIELEFEKALSWLQKGAQPTDTARAILSYKGVMYKNHLLKGIKKGALTLAEVETKFEDWLQKKEALVQAKIDKLAEEAHTKSSKRMAKETAIKEARAKILAAKSSELAKALGVKVEAKVEEPKVEAKVEEPKADVPKEVVNTDVPEEKTAE